MDMSSSPSALQRKLVERQFVVTTELSPPDTAEPERIRAAARILAPHADAINATDGAGANCHMSSIAVCTILASEGIESVWQITCRDRNRIAIQGDALGAAALGVRNVLCLTGDDVTCGDHPAAARVFDLDSVTLLRCLRTMRDEACFMSGRGIEVAPNLFIGAVENPTNPPIELRVERVARKIAAGAEFIQTNYIFDLDTFKTFMRRMRDRGLDHAIPILAGVGPLSSAAAARRMMKRVPGLNIPEALIDRLDRSRDPKREGREICIELIQELAVEPGVSGVHLMAFRREHEIAEILERAGVR
ncbi:MAG: methylenetetrahydrofolate reductase [Rhizobiales bacterium]|nr:methylenetetrahydrofolate reductase [Hyphomicrobiales bacterium]